MAKKGQTFICEECSAEFYRTQSYIKRGNNIRYCTMGCYSAACANGNFTKPSTPQTHRRNGQTFTCPHCGEEFYRKASFIKRGITKTCGKPECISLSMRKENNPFWGKEHSPEVKEAIKEARTSRPSGKKRTGPPKGYKHTPEARAKMSEAVKLRWLYNRDKMMAHLVAREPKRREELRYRRNFTRWQRKNWKDDKCGWCCSTEQLVLDHIVSVMDGGTNIQENAQTLCQPCNVWKMAYVDRPLYLARLALQGGSAVG